MSRASVGPGAYPLREVMTLAWQAIQRDPANVRTLAETLRSSNEVLRYWAALGCCMLGDGAADARQALERVFVNDGSIQVRIVAAEALARQDVTSETVPFLGDTLVNHPDRRLRLQAACALEAIGERARPALAQLALAQKNVELDDLLGQDTSRASFYTLRKLSGTYVPGP